MTAQAQATDGGLEMYGIDRPARVRWNLGMAALVEEAVRRHEGLLAASGPLVCRTTPHTGRSPNDKFIVREPSSEGNVWWGEVNRSITPQQFDALHRAMATHLNGRELFVRDCHVGADPAYRLPIRVITETAWHSLFAHHMFISEPDPQRLASHAPAFTVINAPTFQADPTRHGTNSTTAIAIHFDKRLALVGGTSYAGEIKKSIFTAMNYLLPLRDVMPMHCSANLGPAGDTALFFGLSGTGKTTLSSDVQRNLIGDDEHGWSASGVFNFEGGCYAKLIKLSATAEPQIYATTRRFGTLLENVVMDATTRQLDFEDDALTENTRGAYPISYIENFVASGAGAHPRNVIMLTADAFGVLPPISRLTAAGAMYHFLSGYTAKVAGTEKGLTEPTATFSACFGAPFMVWRPNVYARLLGERIARHGSKVWLLNTGWTGGPYGVGRRMPIEHTRAMVGAVLSGALDHAAYQTDPVFGLEVPTSCPGASDEVLAPRGTWSREADYDAMARRLAEMFIANFKAFEASADVSVLAAGPRR